jgi:hypothetical protein
MVACSPKEEWTRMFEFHVNLTVEVTQVGNALAIQTPVPIQLRYQAGRWGAECQAPPITTALFDRMEEAVVAGARAVGAELQMDVCERPVIAGRITPADVPRGRF